MCILSGGGNPKLPLVSAAGRAEPGAAVRVGAAGGQPEAAAGDDEEAAGEGADHQSSASAGQCFPHYKR